MNRVHPPPRIDSAAAGEPSVPATAPAAERSRLLSEIGGLVRRARAKRGMTRKTLASRSGTSERYLALIESGEGNPTVLVLEGVAQALGLRLFDLLPLGADEIAQARAVERVRRLDAAQIDRLLAFLDGQAEAPADRRGRRIGLIGLRGAGKSTLGAGLAKRLGCPFIELDKMVEREHGANVAMLFEVYGHSAFRRYERECLDKVVAEHHAVVIATSGGIVADDETFARLLATTHVVWLRATPEDHMNRVMEQGDLRPMARNRDAMNDLIAILQAREAEYGRAHARLETSGKGLEAALGELTAIAQHLFGREEL